MKSLTLFVLLFLSGNVCAGTQIDTCQFATDYVSTTAQPQNPSVFRDISRHMKTSEIIQRLGPPARDVGSGLYVLQWDVSDGRTYWVSTPGPCEKPLSFGFHKAPPNNSFKPTPHRGVGHVPALR
jgi:hypothetical protein